MPELGSVTTGSAGGAKVRGKLISSFFLVCSPLLFVSCSPPSNYAPASPETTTTQPSHPPDPSDKWTVTKNESELDHKVRLTVSDSEVVLRCSPKFEAYINPYIPSLGHSLRTEDGHGQSVRYRVDEGSIHRERWNISDDYTALFLPTSTLKSVLKGKKLVVEFKPDYVSAQSEIFDLDGLVTAGRKAGCKI